MPALLLIGRRPRRRGGPRVLADLERAAGVERATRRWLLYFVVPVWLGAGLADWDRHRKTNIETTSGTHESAIHALMMTEAGLPALLGLFLEVNAGVLLTAVAALIVHELTAIWDVAYAVTRRRVTPTEQHIHSLLEVVPLMAVSFLMTLHWDQARALVGVGPDRPDFGLRPKRRPLARPYIVGLLTSIMACVGVPYAEELWRCYRVDRSLSARPEPPRPATETLRIPD